MARHINPNNLQDTAIAPYNFVPLPNKPLIVENGLEVENAKVMPWNMHDRFAPGLCSGVIDLTVETLTSLYIRGAARKDAKGQWDKRESRLREEPFTTPDGRPAIPGSSLRGMVRNLFEIISFSKVEPVSTEKPFYRSVGNDRLGDLYRLRMIPNNTKPAGGILRKNGGQWHIECCDVYRVPHHLLPHEVIIPKNPNEYPDGKYQYRPCKIKGENERDVTAIAFEKIETLGPPWKAAILVLTGPAVKKKAEFALVSSGAARSIRVPEDMIERFHDEDQITQWQQRAFTGKIRKPKGGLAEGDAVFYLLDKSFESEENPQGLVFFGRAQMFRLPYDVTPFDMLPKSQRVPGLDMAQALFGRVGQHGQDKGKTIKGRLRFEDVVADCPAGGCLEAPGVPEILGSPKVTTFQHYLTQNGTQDAKNRTTYFEKDHTTLRGHKQYWHRDTEWKSRVSPDEVRKHPDRNTQNTIIQPVRKGTPFTGRIHFENLAPVELGALLYALQLPAGYAHKMGMGKPIGLGSVRITPVLRLLDVNARYASWSMSGFRKSDGQEFKDAFAQFILRHAGDTQETLLESQSGLRKIARIDALFHMLSWDKKPPAAETRYMVIQNGKVERFGDRNEYKKRAVLPTPHHVAGAQEPPWTPDPPVAVEVPKEQRKKEPRKNPQDGARQTRPAEKYAPPPLPPQRSGPKPVQQGQSDREGILKRDGDTWVAHFEGESQAALVLQAEKIPGGTEPGAKAKFYIHTKNKQAFKVRFDRLV